MGPIVMLDAGFRNDPKIVHLRLLRGRGDAFDFLVLLGVMREHGPIFNTDEEAFWPWIAKQLDRDEESTREFMHDLLDKDQGGRIGLLVKDDDGHLWSPRLVRDVETYMAKAGRQSEGGKLGVAIKKLRSNGEAEAATLLNLLKLPPMRKEQFLEQARSHEIPEKDAEALFTLIKDHSRDCVLHYAFQCSDYLQANGAEKADFVAYMRTWIRNDKAASRGWFAKKKAA
jgi:hypothetical protein